MTSEKSSGAPHPRAKTHTPVKPPPPAPVVPPAAPPKIVQSEFGLAYLWENFSHNGFGGWLMLVGYVFSIFMGFGNSWTAGVVSYGPNASAHSSPRDDFTHLGNASLADGTIFSVGAVTWLPIVVVSAVSLILWSRRHDLQSSGYRAGPIVCAIVLLLLVNHYSVPDTFGPNSSGYQISPPGPGLFLFGQFLVFVGCGLAWWRDARSKAPTASPK
jgi:hypothetical protein